MAAFYMAAGADAIMHFLCIFVKDFQSTFCVQMGTHFLCILTLDIVHGLCYNRNTTTIGFSVPMFVAARVPAAEAPAAPLFCRAQRNCAPGRFVRLLAQAGFAARTAVRGAVMPRTIAGRRI